MPKELKIATMNLHNLQLAGKTTYGSSVVTQKTYDGKINWVASMITKLDADVIGFQELWHPDALTDAFQRANLLDDYELVSKKQGHAIMVAMAVRKPLEVIHTKWESEMPDELILEKKKKAYAGEPEYGIDVSIKKFSRPILRVNIKVDGSENVIAYVAHLKSKLPMKIYRESYYAQVKPHVQCLGSALSTIRRAAEAAGLRILLNKTMKGTDHPVVVMGDLNDSQMSVTTSIITEDPGYRKYLTSRTGNRSDKGLYSVATLQELRSLRDVYYTYIHDGFRESLDHILVSEQFYDFSKKRVWSFKETRIFNDHIDDKKGKGYASDHGIVLTTFDYNPST